MGYIEGGHYWRREQGARRAQMDGRRAAAGDGAAEGRRQSAAAFSRALQVLGARALSAWV